MNQALDGRTVLVTGANGGLGEHFVRQAVQRGAAKVYAAARTGKEWNDTRIVPLTLDLTSPDDAERVAAEARDVNLLINNAAVAPVGDSITGPEEALRQIFETNFFGTVRLARAFTPVLAAHGGGTLLNVLSSAAWVPVPTGYGASKAALWSATNALRFQLRAQGTQVVALLVGMIDTPMSARWDVPKVSPESVVAQAYDAVADGSIEVLADDQTRYLKSRLNTKAEELYPWLGEQLAGFEA
ncbi:oxidoreductase [Paractinoplanes abujensis]|uniref:NAD(P)-dependent dehydrogenase (Short-subunit alcohol dehydrogenase family) n=1 Tax=Paractinoplanes abujensis TaxID=882441 RepID=A0A7W7G1Q7_9ACTN|nr:SDR family oxidoreductase [Actinoplanes abujensis]MBB4692410.1 NAD(P)-dependent dehydrogenase (short-subunit alcohol dehydrogenase family) [Actinoplanes abujensis]GID24113.1 oxidoreductase [Actinoplanes abujensis]